jgi:hypothetical protein
MVELLTWWLKHESEMPTEKAGEILYEFVIRPAIREDRA